MSDATFPRKDFAEILEARNPPLAKHLAEIRARAAEDWMHFLGDDKGSHTGYVHLRNVERNANKIVPAVHRESFSDGEIFLLLASALLHDIGKIVPKDVPVDPRFCRDGSCDWGFRCPLKEWEHHCAGKRFLDENWAVLGLPDARIAGYCGLMTYSHGLSDPLDRSPACLGRAPCVLGNPGAEDYRNTALEPYGSLRIPLLAAILRIADETENTWTRALRREAFALYSKSGRNVAKAFRRGVEDVTFSHAGRCIIMHVPGLAEPNADELYLILQSLAVAGKSAEKVVRAWSGALRPVDAVFSRVLFEHGGRLYHDPSSGFREPPPLATVFHERDPESGDEHPELREDHEFVEQLFDAVKKLSRGSNGYRTLSLSAVEASLDRPLDDHRTWIVQRMGEVHPGLRVEAGSEPGSLRVAVNEALLNQIEREITGPKTKESKESLEAESKTKDPYLYKAVRKLWRGAYGPDSLSWAAIEAEVGHRMEAGERWRLLQLSNAYPDVDIQVDREAAGRLTITFDETRKTKAKAREERLKDLLVTVDRTSRMTWMRDLTWQMIEGELGGPLTVEDRKELGRVQNETGIWHIGPLGLTIETETDPAQTGLTDNQKTLINVCWKLGEEANQDGG
jgi:hypothetical protein